MQIQSMEQFQEAYAHSKAVVRGHVRAWIQSVCDIEDCTPTQLAKRTGVDPTTLNRFLADRPHTPNLPTLMKISQETGIPLSDELLNMSGPFSLRAHQTGPRRKQAA